ncbi:phosphoinositide phosphatase SAC8-like [Malus sylvestris]|uniref:phosphoinositide phosphatase SAC8-like n=1 Tax=Malus sylvestris TaxID=3752 RepID=UPI0021ACD3E3|nr:phosphoinositide phosphatase SAC8-like [Malus sylvestris]
MDGGGSCSGGNFKLYEELEVQEFQDKFVIKSVAAPDRGFSIDRRDGIIEPLNGDSSSSTSPSKKSTINGVAGTIRLLAGYGVCLLN